MEFYAGDGTYAIMLIAQVKKSQVSESPSVGSSQKSQHVP